MNFINQLFEKLKEEKCILYTKNVDLAEMRLLSKYKKGIKYILCAIDLFSKYAFFVPLKDKKGISIVNAFRNILDR